MMSPDELYGRKDELLGQITTIQDELDRIDAGHPASLGLLTASRILSEALEELQKIEPASEATP